MPRFSLSGLLAAVVVIALFCTALASSSEGWLRAVRLLTLFLLLAMCVFAIYSRGPSRTFAVGFTLFGLTFGYLLFLRDAAVADHWGVRPLFESSFDFIEGPALPEPKLEVDQRGQASKASEEALMTWHSRRIEGVPRRRNFTEIGHLALVILLAMAGGTIALYAQHRARDAKLADPTKGPPGKESSKDR